MTRRAAREEAELDAWTNWMQQLVQDFDAAPARVHQEPVRDMCGLPEGNMPEWIGAHEHTELCDCWCHTADAYVWEPPACGYPNLHRIGICSCPEHDLPEPNFYPSDRGGS